MDGNHDHSMQAALERAVQAYLDNAQPKEKRAASHEGRPAEAEVSSPASFRRKA